MNQKQIKIMFTIIEMVQTLNIKAHHYNTAGWTTVEVAGQIIEKIGPILATKYSEIN